MALRKNPSRPTDDPSWRRLLWSRNKDFMLTSVLVWELSVGGIEKVNHRDDRPTPVDVHKADVHWPVPTHIPETLMPAHFGQFETEDGVCRMLQRNCGGDGVHLIAVVTDNDPDAETTQQIFEALWSRRSYRWRCRLWFIWREYIRDVWDFLKKPILIAALVGYPVVHVLAAVGVLGCDCPPPPQISP